MNKKIISIILLILLIITFTGIIFIQTIVTDGVMVLTEDLVLEIDVTILTITGIILIFILIVALVAINSNKRNRGMQKPIMNETKKEKIKEKFVNEKKAVQENFKEKRELINNELKIAETQFLKNKIDKMTFDNISKQKNTELISVEAKIDFKNKAVLSKDELKNLDKISENKRKILKGLLEEKQKKVLELQISEKSYLKRKIDENTFRKISSEIKSEIISIEGKIQAIQKSDEIEKIKNELKKGANEIAKQKASSQKRKNENDIFEEEVFEQIDDMVGGLKK